MSEMKHNANMKGAGSAVGGGGYNDINNDACTADSTPQTSTQSAEEHDSPSEQRQQQQELKVDMTIIQDVDAYLNSKTNNSSSRQQFRFPSAASLTSSGWSSSGYSTHSSDGDSYAWSASLGTSDEDSDDDSDYSSFSGSDDEDDDSYIDDALLEENKGRFPPRPLAPRPLPPRPAAASSSKIPPMPPPMMMGEGLPIGLGGLPMSLESLKRDLEKVGRAIIQSNAGEVAAERAQTLASINWLASHVPNAVLDHLGHETRALIEEQNGGASVSDESKGSRVASVVTSDAMSDVSDLSHLDLKGLEGMVEDEDTKDQEGGGNNQQHHYPTNTSEMMIVEPSDPASATAKPIKRPSASPGDLQSMGLVVGMDLDDNTDNNNIPNPLANLGQKNGSNGLDTSHRSAFSSRSRDTEISSNRSPSKHFKRFSITRQNNTKTDNDDDDDDDDADKPETTTRFQNEVKMMTKPHPPEADLESEGSSLSSSDSSGSSEQSEESASLAMSSDNQEGKQTTKGEGLRALPHSNSYGCAILFADISGFTKLSTLLDPESLSKAINAYFQLIVNEVLDGKGDILKFAGDAVFIEWKASEDIHLESCLEAAVRCASKIVSRCSDFSVLSNGAFGETSCLITGQASKVETLNVHCGIGAGQMIGVHVGDHDLRREYILLGPPIHQATKATAFARLGEVAVSPEAYRIFSRSNDFDSDVTFDGINPTVVASRNRSKFASKQRMGQHQHKVIINDVSRGVTRHVEGLEVEALRKYRRQMSLYVHPVVVDNDLAAAGNLKKSVRRLQKCEQERHRQEAEIRNVYVMFVNPMVQTQTSNNARENHKIFKTLNDVMNLSSREIKRYSGHLRQFIVDDKGKTESVRSCS